MTQGDEMALDLLRSAKGILKTDDLTIDNVVFKLHYRVTVAILIGSSLIGVAKQYFGDPINCQVRNHWFNISGRVVSVSYTHLTLPTKA